MVEARLGRGWGLGLVVVEVLLSWVGVEGWVEKG